MERPHNSHIQVENNIISVADEELPFKDGIGTIIFEKMQAAKNKKAQIDILTGDVDNYKDYFQRCLRTAVAMRKKGIKPNDIVTVCSSTHFDTSVPIIASFFLGAKPSNIDPKFTTPDSVHLLRQVDPKMIFVSVDGIDLVEEVVGYLKNVPEIVVFGKTNKHTPFSDFLQESAEETEFKPIQVKNLKETAVVYFSSGSTGLPKGICLNHLSLLNIIKPSLNILDFVFFSTSPAYWTTFTIVLLMAIISGSCRLIVNSFDQTTFWNTLEKFKVNFALLSSMQVAFLVQGSSPCNYDLSNLKTVVFGGSPVIKEQIVKIKAYLPNTAVFCAYGLSEFGIAGLEFKPSSSYDLQLANQKPTSCGRPRSGFSYKVVDRITEKALGPNQPGELRIKSKYQMNGYYKMDASDEWDSDGFIRTGDVAYYDEDYCFYVTDRIREIFKYQSWQITPFKIETILMTHPAIENAVVVGIPHSIDSERPAALVVLRENFIGSVKEDEVQEFVAEKVNNAHRLRGGVIFVKNLLTTPTGKYRRRYMRELVLNGRIKELQ